MFRTLHIFPRLLIVCGIIAGSVAVLPSPVLYAEPGSPDDAPVPVVSDNVEEWTVGQGLVYWANNCFADEFNPFAVLKRKPASGGPERTLESINDSSRCSTYQAMLSSGDGLYYYSSAQNRIERMPLGAPFTPQVVKALSNGQAPITNKALVEAGDYLYWVYPFGKILRIHKDGTGGVETVAETASSPADVMVTGDTVYWTDSTGVWTINTACGALPCTSSKSQFAPFGVNTGGYGLLYLYVGGVQGRYSVYWVQRSTAGSASTYQIRYRSCTAARCVHLGVT